MKLIAFSLALCSVLLVSACSDSNSVDDLDGENASMNSTNGSNTASEQTDEQGTDTANNQTDTAGAEGETPNTEQTTSTDQNNTTDSDSETNNVVDETLTNQPAATFADYRITFDATWSAESHPIQFPANAHFSGLVGAVHNDQVTFWEPGQIATDGIEFMAETGGKSIFLSEISSAIDSGYALAVIDGPGITLSPGSASVEIRVTIENPKVTLTTMLAPSPDWFTGFHNIRFFDDGEFIDSMSLDGIVYDSGTDSGLSFTSANSDTQPRDTIIRTSSEATDSPFQQGLPSVGRFIIERL